MVVKENPDRKKKEHRRILAIEVYKSSMKTNPNFMWDFYTIKPVSCDLRTGEKLYLPTVNTTPYGLNSLIFREVCSGIIFQILFRQVKV